MNCECPHCGSRGTQALSVIHANGARTKSWRSNSLLYYRRSVGIRATAGHGRSQSLASIQSAPPVAVTTRLLGSGIVVALVVLLTLFGGVVVFLLTMATLLGVAVLGGKAEAV